MRTIQELIDDYSESRYEPDNNGIMQMTYYIESGKAKDMIKEYATRLIDHILSHPEMIHTENYGGWAGNTQEALYDYEKFNQLKQQIK